MLVSYGQSDLIAEGTNADIDTTEEDIVVVTDRARLEHSQVTLYPDITLGTNTSMILRVYFLDRYGGTWVQESEKDASTSAISGSSYVYTTANGLTLPVNIPMPACYGLKVTGQGAGGANSSVTVRILGRNN